jgi:hypothetical protein
MQSDCISDALTPLKMQSDCINDGLPRFTHPMTDGRHFNPGAWRATGLHAQGSARCAPPFTPPKKCGGTIRKRLPAFAKANTAQTTTTAYAE